MNMSWTSFGLAVCAMLCFAALYEPVRQNLLHDQTYLEVGGVGGVGGLVNLGGPNNNCARGYQGNYCYEEGAVGGFTPFALGTLFFWVGPLLLACLVQYFTNTTTAVTTPQSTATATTIPAVPREPDGKSLSWLAPVWYGLNLLWFAVPMVSYGFGLKELDSVFIRLVLAIALAAAHPLSWNLSLVMIPIGGIASKLALLSEETSNQWFAFHRLAGYTTAFWGLLHGFCELTYLLSNKEGFRSLWQIGTHGESLLYWAGIILFILMALHAGAAYYRRYWKPQFQRVHGAIAAALLLMAAVHWWPFALFFIPAIAVYGLMLSNRCFRSNPVSIAHWGCQRVALGLGLSLIAALVGLAVVWSWREAYMSRPTANLYIPFLFPPAAVIASFLASFLTSAVLLNWFQNNSDSAVSQLEFEPEAPCGEEGELTALTPLITSRV